MLLKAVRLPGGSTLAVLSEFAGALPLFLEVARGHRIAQLGVSTARCVAGQLATKFQAQMASIAILSMHHMWME